MGFLVFVGFRVYVVGFMVFGVCGVFSVEGV